MPTSVFGRNGNINVSAFFKADIIAVFVRQDVFNAQVSITLFLPFNGNLRPFWFLREPRWNDFLDRSGH